MIAVVCGGATAPPTPAAILAAIAEHAQKPFPFMLDAPKYPAACRRESRFQKIPTKFTKNPLTPCPGCDIIIDCHTIQTAFVLNRWFCLF
jgi:hypothetical protein